MTRATLAEAIDCAMFAVLVLAIIAALCAVPPEWYEPAAPEPTPSHAVAVR